MPSGSLSASETACSTSSADREVSTTSSLGTDCTPILTCTSFLRDASFPPYTASGVITGTMSCPPVRRSGGARESADTAPGQAGDEVLGRFLGDRAALRQPVAGADLGHADQAHAQQVRLVAGDAGVLLDDLSDLLGALLVGLLDPGPYGRDVAQVGLEDQAERLALAGHEVIEGHHGPLDPQLVVRRGGQGLPHPLDESLGVLVLLRQVELELAGKVLVEHWFADAGALGDLVHRGGVVALGDEHLLGRAEQLTTACHPREPGASRAGVRGCGHVVLRSAAERRGNARAPVAIILRPGNTEPRAAPHRYSSSSSSSSSRNGRCCSTA